MTVAIVEINGQQMVSLRAYEIVVEEREALRAERDALLEAAALARPRRKTRALGQDPLPRWLTDPVRARSHGRCVACGKPGRDIHHVLAQSKFAEHRLDQALMVLVCRRCHEEHETAAHRVPFEALPWCVHERVAEFADPRVTAYVRRNYPKTRVPA